MWNCMAKNCVYLGNGGISSGISSFILWFVPTWHESGQRHTNIEKRKYMWHLRIDWQSIQAASYVVLYLSTNLYASLIWCIRRQLTPRAFLTIATTVPPTLSSWIQVTGLLIKTLWKFPQNPFIPTWSLSKKFPMPCQTFLLFHWQTLQ